MTPTHVTEALNAVEEHLELEDASAHYLSTVWHLARKVQEEIEEEYAPVKAQADALVKPWATHRSRSKRLVESAKERLGQRYAAEDKLIQDLTEAAVQAGDQRALAQLPDAPELADCVTFAELKEVEVADASAIPREFLVPDTKAIAKALKEGKEVPGATLTIKRSWRLKK